MTRKVLLCKYNFYFIGGDWLEVQRDADGWKAKGTPGVSAEKYRPVLDQR